MATVAIARYIDASEHDFNRLAHVYPTLKISLKGVYPIKFNPKEVELCIPVILSDPTAA